MSHPNHRPIGVFDSGLGGLTVVKEITRLLPHENIIYVGDTARVPYGTKSAQTVTAYSREIAQFLIRKRVKAIVVACNTASAVAMKSLRHMRIPFLGVIRPGARAAAQATNTKRIGVIGTQATINSHAYRRAIHWIEKKSKIWELPCPLFVPLVEAGWVRKPATRDIAREYLDPLLKKKIDTLVLGCTHYPLLKEVLAKVTRSKIKLIDSAEETAVDLKKLLELGKLSNPRRANGRIQYFVTDNPETFTKAAHGFLGRRGAKARRLYLENL